METRPTSTRAPRAARSRAACCWAASPPSRERWSDLARARSVRYIAPELLKGHKYGAAVDWWSFGTLLYEMMCGLPPFYDTNVQRMYTKILSSPLRFPSYLSEDARGVLTGLLKRPVSERLGSGPTRFGEIQGHAFYKPLDFEKG